MNKTMNVYVALDESIPTNKNLAEKIITARGEILAEQTEGDVDVMVEVKFKNEKKEERQGS